MTDKDKQLLAELDYGIITNDVFMKNFSVDIQGNPHFVRKEVVAAIESEHTEEIQMLLSLIWLSGDIPHYVDLLNELLINSNHQSHQRIAKALQDIAPSPNDTSVYKKST